MEKFKQIKFNEVNIKKVDDFETSFIIQPLERGFGQTMGNSLRRVLLSSVGALAPFAVKIAGVSNEFMTIPNVKEDVVTIIMNLKNVKFRYKGDKNSKDLITVSLKSKKGAVLSTDLVLPVNVELVGEPVEIANTEKIGAIDLEMYLRSGRGFVSFTRNKEFVKNVAVKLNTKLGSGEIIAIDSLFSSIEKVSYDVQELNSISEDIEEKLTIDVKTNGSIDAKAALSEAAHILKAHLEVLENMSDIKFEEDIFVEKVKNEEESKVMSIPIVDLELSVRSYNALKKNGITKVSELVTMRYEELETIKHLGKKSLDEIVKKLEELGIQIKSKGA